MFTLARYNINTNGELNNKYLRILHQRSLLIKAFLIIETWKVKTVYKKILQANTKYKFIEELSRCCPYDELVEYNNHFRAVTEDTTVCILSLSGSGKLIYVPNLVGKLLKSREEKAIQPELFTIAVPQDIPKQRYFSSFMQTLAYR